MSDEHDPKRLEAIERELRDWSARLDVSAPPEARSAVRQGVMLALNELWLSSQAASVSPRATAVARSRLAVAAELDAPPQGLGHDSLRQCDDAPPDAQRGRPASGGCGSRRSVRGHGPAFGSLAAAAMLLLCVGIIRYAPSRLPSADPDDVADLVGALEIAASNDAITQAVLDVQRHFSDTEALPDTIEESLDDLVQEMDRILDRLEPVQRNSSLAPGPSGVVG
ncbi:MAG: hypothetical protein AMXMBFR83_22570 [Phycisphaerae bacterium]